MNMNTGNIEIKTQLNNNTNITDFTSNDETNDMALNIIYIILAILIIFMIAFIYNLIKCYLPMLLNKNKRLKKNDDTIDHNSPHYDLENVEDNTV